MANTYRLKKQYRNKAIIVVAGGRGYKVDFDFYQRYNNANNLITEFKEIGHFFEDQEGKPVNDAGKPVAKAKKTRKSKQAEE